MPTRSARNGNIAPLAISSARPSRDYLGGLFGRDLGWRITYFDPPRAMVLENWGAFVLQPDTDGRTRLLIRTRMGGPSAPVWGAAVAFTAFELPHFIMQRKMLLGIKERAERPTRVARERHQNPAFSRTFRMASGTVSPTIQSSR
jgi:hypothetical protein